MQRTKSIANDGGRASRVVSGTGIPGGLAMSLTDGNRAGVLISQASLRHHMKRPWGIVCNGVLAIADPDSLEFGFVELSIFDDVVQIVP